MMSLLDVTIRSSVLLLVGLCVAGAMRRQSAACRHGVIAGAIFTAAAVAPLGWAVPSWEIATPAAPAFRSVASPHVPVNAGIDAAGTHILESSGAATVSLAIAVWLAGVLGMSALLSARLRNLSRTSRHAIPVTDERWRCILEQLLHHRGVRRRVLVLETRTPGLIATWGVFRHRILVPEEARQWKENRIRAVLGHELAHVRRHDWVVQIAAELVRSFYWFNPLVTIACRSLRRESELACDDEVLGAGVSAPDYASHLLELAHLSRSGRALGAVMQMARRSTLERRIAAMLDTCLDRRPLSRRAAVVTAVLLFCAALPLAAVRGAQDSPRPLTGAIYDASGGVLPGVSVTLRDSQDFTWTATTDASGQFEFPPVQPGRYVLEARLVGFRTLHDEFDLKTARDWARAITMPVGELQETIHVTASRTSPPVASQAPRPVRVGGNVKAPLKIFDVRPMYPASMREAGLSGVVPIEAIIATDGSVLAARVRGAHVHPDFAAAALDAVRQWRFTPTLLNGAPVEVVMNVTVTFTLAD